jgi:pilus assembly protein FimV
MFRKMAVVTALLLATLSAQVFALGLGDIDMRSALNQPMDAVIELTSASAADIDDIDVSLASLDDHVRAGLSKAAILADFRFTIEKNAAGKPVVRISSDSLVREPYLEFMLELDWSRGRLLRQYTVLVDPPVTMPATPAVPVAPVTRAAPAPRPVTRTPVATPVQQPVAAPATVNVAPAPVTGDYGPIRRSETLWSIAERVRPDREISIDQVMLALQRANPHAFDGNNINRLRRGVTLTVPTRDDILSMSSRAARAESARQFEEWKSANARPAAEAAPVAEATAAEQPEIEASAAVAVEEAQGESRLQLMAPETDAVSGDALPGVPATGEAAPGVKGVQQQLALATEEVVAERAQSRELQSRVGELEEQITTMKRLLELKDDELARLQQTLGAEEGLPEEEALAVVEDIMSDTAGEVESGVEESAEAESEAATVVAETAETGATGLTEKPDGLVNRLMENPLLAGLGVLVAMFLGGFVWASTRARSGAGILDDDLTMERQLAAVTARENDRSVPEVSVNESVPEIDNDFAPEVENEADSDPVTEADVYLAYGRIQQAEDVLLAALQSRPENVEARLKLLEVYHSGGNAVAFDQAATAFHEMFGKDNDNWQKIAAMGVSMSPQNTLYGGDKQVSADETDFDMDLSGLEEDSPVEESPVEDSNTIEFTLNTGDDEEEDAGEGLLEADDEVTTKLDLARAYIDMDDQDSARSILGEVIQEGNAEQKEEAESIISKLA